MGVAQNCYISLTWDLVVGPGISLNLQLHGINIQPLHWYIKAVLAKLETSGLR